VRRETALLIAYQVRWRSRIQTYLQLQPTYLNRKRSGEQSMLVKLLSHAAQWQEGQQGVLHMAKATLPES
jgi:hypothetical protein